MAQAPHIEVSIEGYNSMGSPQRQLDSEGCCRIYCQSGRASDGDEECLIILPAPPSIKQRPSDQSGSAERQDPKRALDAESVEQLPDEPKSRHDPEPDEEHQSDDIDHRDPSAQPKEGARGSILDGGISVQEIISDTQYKGSQAEPGNSYHPRKRNVGKECAFVGIHQVTSRQSAFLGNVRANGADFVDERVGQRLIHIGKKLFIERAWNGGKNAFTRRVVRLYLSQLAKEGIQIMAGGLNDLAADRSHFINQGIVHHGSPSSSVQN
jgi:hypothetical protein